MASSNTNNTNNADGSTTIRTRSLVFVAPIEAGAPTDANLHVVDGELAVPAQLPDGKVLVALAAYSVDPYMQGRLRAAKSEFSSKNYVPPFEPSKPIASLVVVRVVRSTFAGVAEGEWRKTALPLVSHQIVDGKTLAAGELLLDAAAAAATKTMSSDEARATRDRGISLGLGRMTTLTAYFGLLRVAGGMREGDTVLVSSAAGATGCVVGQIARLSGARRVVGLAGSDEKCALLTREYGFDAAINYKKHVHSVAAMRAALADAAGDAGGYDFYFDNVGGVILDAAVRTLRPRGRIAACGCISSYLADENDADVDEKASRDRRPSDGAFVTLRLTLQGFIAADFADEEPAALERINEWQKAGKLRQPATLVRGFDQCVNAFTKLFAGENIGKLLVVCDDISE